MCGIATFIIRSFFFFFLHQLLSGFKLHVLNEWCSFCCCCSYCNIHWLFLGLVRFCCYYSYADCKISQSLSKIICDVHTQKKNVHRTDINWRRTTHPEKNGCESIIRLADDKTTSSNGNKKKNRSIVCGDCDDGGGEGALFIYQKGGWHWKIYCGTAIYAHSAQ